MPTAQDMQFARPLCQRRRLMRDGQHGIHVTCWRPLAYCSPDNRWWCEDCQAHTDGYVVAAQVHAAEALVVA